MIFSLKSQSDIQDLKRVQIMTFHILLQFSQVFVINTILIFINDAGAWSVLLGTCNVSKLWTLWTWFFYQIWLLVCTWPRDSWPRLSHRRFIVLQYSNPYDYTEVATSLKRKYQARELRLTCANVICKWGQNVDLQEVQAHGLRYFCNFMMLVYIRNIIVQL